MPNKLPPLVTLAPVDQWIQHALGAIVRPHVARLETATGITGLDNAFRAHVSEPCGRACDLALREALRKVGSRG